MMCPIAVLAIPHIPQHIQTKCLLLVNSASPAPLRGCIDVGTGECVFVCFVFCPEPPQILRARFQLDTRFGGRQPVIKAFILWEGKLVLSVSPGGGGGGKGGRRGTTVLFRRPIWGPFALSLASFTPGSSWTCLLSALPLESALKLLEAVPRAPTYRGNHSAVPCPSSTDGRIPRTSLSSEAFRFAQPQLDGILPSVIRWISSFIIIFFFLR